MHQVQLHLDPSPRGLREITDAVRAAVADSGVQTGLCHVFVHDTSASLIIQENADPSVRADLESFFARLVPDGDPRYTHADEGPDDMPAHIRGALTATAVTAPVTAGRLALGTWQGIFLWEHRSHAKARRITVTIIGA